MNENKTCKNCRFRDGNVVCNNCTVVFNHDATSERFGKRTDPSNWLPRTEAQMLDDEVFRRSSSLSGNIDTGYVYTSGSSSSCEPIKLSGSLGLKSTKRKEYNKMYKSPKERAFDRIKKVIFNNPATIVFWTDGTKTVVTCGKEDTFDPEKGLAMAITKYFFGNAGWFNDVFKKYLPEKTEIMVPTDLKKNMKKLDDKTTTRLYSVKEFSEEFGMSEDTVRRNIKNGCYPEAIKEHGKWSIPYTFEEEK